MGDDLKDACGLTHKDQYKIDVSLGRGYAAKVYSDPPAIMRDCTAERRALSSFKGS